MMEKGRKNKVEEISRQKQPQIDEGTEKRHGWQPIWMDIGLAARKWPSSPPKPDSEDAVNAAEAMAAGGFSFLAYSPGTQSTDWIGREWRAETTVASWPDADDESAKNKFVAEVLSRLAAWLMKV
jgi:hypothetical protein